MPSVRRCHVARFRHPTAVRCPREQRGTVMGLGISGPIGWIAPTFASQFSRPGSNDGIAIFQSRHRRREIQQFLDDRARAWLFAFRHACDQSGRPAVSNVNRPRGLRPIHECRRIVSGSMGHPEFEGVIPQGTPVAQCFPIGRARLDLVFEPFTEQDARRYQSTAEKLLSQPGVYRKEYRVRRTYSAAK